MTDERFTDEELGEYEEVGLVGPALRVEAALGDAIRDREVYRSALADIYTGRVGPHPSGDRMDDQMFADALVERARKALFDETEAPPEGYPA